MQPCSCAARNLTCELLGLQLEPDFRCPENRYRLPIVPVIFGRKMAATHLAAKAKSDRLWLASATKVGLGPDLLDHSNGLYATSDRRFLLSEDR